MKTTLRQLEIFVAAVENGSFRAAAQALGLSQVVVSEHIRAMEHRLGVVLFERRAGSRPALTRAGQEAFDRGRRLLSDYRDFEGAFAAQQAQPLRVIAPPFLLRNAATAIGDLRAQYPQADLKLDTTSFAMPALIDLVETRQADMGFFYAARPVAHPLVERIGSEPLAVFVGQSHPLTHRAAVAAQDLAETPAIHLTPEHPLRREIDLALADIGASPGPIALETDEFGLILSSAARNSGFVCMFEATGAETGQTMGLSQLTLVPPIAPLGIYVVRRAATRHRPILQRLVDLVTS